MHVWVPWFVPAFVKIVEPKYPSAPPFSKLSARTNKPKKKGGGVTTLLCTLRYSCVEGPASLYFETQIYTHAQDKWLRPGMQIADYTLPSRGPKHIEKYGQGRKLLARGWNDTAKDNSCHKSLVPSICHQYLYGGAKSSPLLVLRLFLPSPIFLSALLHTDFTTPPPSRVSFLRCLLT